MNISTGKFSGTITRDTGYHYCVYLPKGYGKELNKTWPLILFLHGMGERGDDLETIKINGPLRCVSEGVELPFIIAAPQCPDGNWWDTDHLISLLDHIENTLNVDGDRVYLTGLSMGGAGTWALANAFPERFAAIAPICGLFTGCDPSRFKGLPIWCFHGTMDPVVPISDSIRMVGWIRDHEGTVKFTTYPDADHDSWTKTYANPELYEWFMEHKRRAPCS